jgi:hypothetical protein
VAFFANGAAACLFGTAIRPMTDVEECVQPSRKTDYSFESVFEVTGNNILERRGQGLQWDFQRGIRKFEERAQEPDV